MRPGYSGLACFHGPDQLKGSGSDAYESGFEFSENGDAPTPDVAWHGRSKLLFFVDSTMNCYPQELLEDAQELGNDQGWTEEVNRRVDLFNDSPLASANPAQCCIGIGYGKAFAIGHNLSQGDEMNRAAKLCEDIARTSGPAVTERVYAALKARTNISMERQSSDDQLFPFY